jgi:hypothetical protein
MNAATLHPLARDYLKRLKKAAASLPRARRRELLREIESHLSEALPPGASEAEVLNVLECLGEPAEIVFEAGTGQAPLPGMGSNERWAIALLLIGGFLFGAGWFIGVVLLWSSRVWTLRDKLIGTLVLPGGVAGSTFIGSFFLASAGSGSGSGTDGGGVALGLTLIVSSVVLPILTSIYLGRRAIRVEVTV